MNELLLKTLVSRARKGIDAPLLKRIREWLDTDWESHDIDKDAIALIRLLVDDLSKLSILR
jgi:methenyltetrahydromethanopterin cyclohydrolase